MFRTVQADRRIEGNQALETSERGVTGIAKNGERETASSAPLSTSVLKKDRISLDKLITRIGCK